MTQRTGEARGRVSHESFAAGVTEETFARFTEETGITVEVLAGGDAGATINQAILTKDAPLGDVLFGVDTTFLSRALAEDLFAATNPNYSPMSPTISRSTPPTW